MSALFSSATEEFGDIAPVFSAYTDNIIYNEVWQRPELSPRDRSLITVATLLALYRENELSIHLKKALEHGVSHEELIEVVTHLAFYAGWPAARTALLVLRRVFEDASLE